MYSHEHDAKIQCFLNKHKYILLFFCLKYKFVDICQSKEQNNNLYSNIIYRKWQNRQKSI